MFAAVKKHVKEGLKRTIVYYVKKFLGEYTNVSYDQVKVSAASWSTWQITFENVDLTPKVSELTQLCLHFFFNLSCFPKKSYPCLSY